MAAMEGVIQIKQAEEDAPWLQMGLDELKIDKITGQGDVIGAVDACDFNIQLAANIPQNSLDSGRRHGYRGHATVAPGQPLRRAAHAHHPDCLLKFKRPRCPGRRHFAHAMPRHGRGLDALLFQQQGDGDLDGEQQGLRNDGIVQPYVGLLRLQLGHHRKAGER